MSVSHSQRALSVLKTKLSERTISLLLNLQHRLHVRTREQMKGMDETSGLTLEFIHLLELLRRTERPGTVMQQHTRALHSTLWMNIVWIDAEFLLQKTNGSAAGCCSQLTTNTQNE